MAARGGDRCFDVLVVGSGFAGSLLAGILARHGWKVVLIDRSRHPRFALGESTTPLANLALERLSERFAMPELYDLATHGRWRRTHPELGCGLKRGFSFYVQHPGETWSADSTSRLLVAASPNDLVADTQWRRADVDAFFAGRAVEEGAELIENVELTSIDATADGLCARLRPVADADRRDGGIESSVDVELVVDASGPAAAAARRLGARDGDSMETASALLAGHFSGVGKIADVVETRRRLDDAPYPEDWAAVHHLLAEGWMYLLRFDDGVTSAGFVLDATANTGVEDATSAWHELIARYPALSALFERARPLRPLEARPRLQHRLSSACGPRWVALPHTYAFVDPLFSSGIAWSLRGVERLADLLLGLGPGAASVASGAAFERYAELLRAESEQLDRLISTAYRARSRLDLFAAHSMLYFAWVSYAESLERLCSPAGPWWSGFLGAGDGFFESLFAESAERLADVLAGATTPSSYEGWISAAIEPFNVAGLADPRRRNLYPVDLDVLVSSAEKLGLTSSEIERALPRLRGMQVGTA